VRVSRLKAFTASAGLSVLFLVVYSGCNWITGQRGQIGSFYFQWERAIPFVPFMILPYMSIDLFFIAAPFLCRTDEELRIFSRRVVAAILIAGVCFLLLPLSRAFARAASCRQSPHRFVLRSGSGGRLAHGRDLLAMGCLASLANDRARHRGERVLRSGSGRFSQDERKVAVEHALCAGALFARSIFVAVILPHPMWILG